MPWFFRALRLVTREKSLWGYIAAPLAAAMTAYLALLIGGYFLFAALLNWAASSLGIQPPVAWAAAGVLVLVLWIFVSGPVFVGLASVASAVVWEKLSSKAEGLVYSDPPSHRLRLGQVVLDLVLRGMVTVFLSLVVLVLGWFGLGLVALLIGGWLGLSDFTAPAYARRGLHFPRQPFAALRCRGSAGFWLMAGLSSLLPVLNVLLLPVWVVAGTLMVAESEASNSASAPIRSTVE
ncbi:MAG: hypothetical protein KF884_06620 [Fimbriimonadaceae bacterium]|nr:hypothetical protein [Fimbriimonadaceae bacterium]QYK57224.1 MAG: hypothetical protein KF884_06620 [Fimbriimonadaceae bacterium]